MGRAGVPCSWVTMSPELVPTAPPALPPSQSPPGPAASSRAQTCTQLWVTTPGQGSHTGSSAPALSQQLHPAGEVATSPFVSVDTTRESLSMMVKNMIWTSQENRREPQHLLELSEKQNFPSASPSQRGLTLRWQEVTAGTAPAKAVRLRGKNQHRAQQQQPPKARLARILETHVHWREGKKTICKSTQLLLAGG